MSARWCSRIANSRLLSIVEPLQAQMSAASPCMWAEVLEPPTAAFRRSERKPLFTLIAAPNSMRTRSRNEASCIKFSTCSQFGTFATLLDVAISSANVKCLICNCLPLPGVCENGGCHERSKDDNQQRFIGHTSPPCERGVCYIASHRPNASPQKCPRTNPPWRRAFGPCRSLLRGRGKYRRIPSG